MVNYNNITNQVDFGSRNIIEFLQDYTLLYSTVSFCHGVRIGQAMTPAIIPAQLYSLPSERYKLRAPVDVILEKHPDEVLALLPELILCGEGKNELEAINDLKADILDLLEDLEDMPEADLGESPKLWKRSLELMVERCQ